MDISQMMKLMQSPNALRDLMLQPAFVDEDTGHQFSQAELIADVVNILRFDTRRIGMALGVDISVTRMEPEEAATLLQGVAQGEDMDLIAIFDEIEEQRMEVLATLIDAEQMAVYERQKQKSLFSFADPDTVEANSRPSALDSEGEGTADEPADD